MGRSAKPRHPHRRRLIKIPMMSTMHDQIGMTLHTAFASMSIAPAQDQFDAIGQIFNMIGMTIEHDPRFVDEFLIIQSGANAMNQIADGWVQNGSLRPTDLELLPVRNAVVVCDEIAPRLDLTKLHLANVRLAALRATA